MRADGKGRVAALAATLLLAACAGATPRSETSPVPGPCRSELRPPGYRLVGTTQITSGSTVGVRQELRDDHGRSLHVSVGVAGEFGEGAAFVGTIPTASGAEARLYGRGEVWVLVWDEGGRCGDRAVIGSGFDREGFVQALGAAGVV